MLQEVQDYLNTYESQAVFGGVQMHSDSAEINGGWNHSNSAPGSSHTNCHSNAVNSNGHCDCHVNN